MDRGRDRPDDWPVPPEPVELAIDGVLDLHQFRPDEAADLVRDYLDACLARNVLEIRIIHGKGIGNLRRVVHAALRRHPAVAEFGLATDASGWGATLVVLVGPGGSAGGGAGRGAQEPSRDG